MKNVICIINNNGRLATSYMKFDQTNRKLNDLFELLSGSTKALNRFVEKYNHHMESKMAPEFGSMYVSYDGDDIVVYSQNTDKEVVKFGDNYEVVHCILDINIIEETNENDGIFSFVRLHVPEGGTKCVVTTCKYASDINIVDAKLVDNDYNVLFSIQFSGYENLSE